MTTTQGPTSPHSNNRKLTTVVTDTLTVRTVTLTASDLDRDALSLPGEIAALVADSPIVVEIHHYGQQLVHRVERDGRTLLGIPWPLEIPPGTKLLVSTAPGGRRIAVEVVAVPTPQSANSPEASHSVLAGRCAMTATAQRIKNVPAHLLWRIAERNVGGRGALALAELERRERMESLNSYANGPKIEFRDLKPGMVVSTNGFTRLVVDAVHKLPASGRVLATMRYTNLVTGEVESQVGYAPVLDGGATITLVSQAASAARASKAAA